MSNLQAQFGSLFADRPSRPPAGFEAAGPARDSPEMEAARPEPQQGVSGLRLGLLYRDGLGRDSRRVVRAKRLVHADNGPALLGHCELRDATRRFSLASIEEAVDFRTGEAFDATLLFGPLLALADGEAAPASEPTIKTIRDCADGLCILQHFAYADEEAGAAEQRVIAEYLAWRAQSAALPRDCDAAYMTRYLNALAPDAEDFEAALLRLLQNDGAHAAKAAELAAKLVLSDGLAHEAERARLKALMDLIEDHEWMTA